MNKETIKTIINLICAIASAIGSVICTTSCVSHLTQV